MEELKKNKKMKKHKENPETEKQPDDCKKCIDISSDPLSQMQGTCIANQRRLDLLADIICELGSPEQAIVAIAAAKKRRVRTKRIVAGEGRGRHRQSKNLPKDQLDRLEKMSWFSSGRYREEIGISRRRSNQKKIAKCAKPNERCSSKSGVRKNGEVDGNDTSTGMKDLLFFCFSICFIICFIKFS